MTRLKRGLNWPLYCLAGFLLISSCLALFDPISIGGMIGFGLGFYNWDTIKKNTFCQFIECCDNYDYEQSINELRKNMRNNLFGQHIVLQQVVPALEAHLCPQFVSRKPLVISFHGTPGTGKNYVAELIATALFKNGLKSRFVHKFMGRSDFPIAENANEYKAFVNKKVRDGISDCSRSLFIFDEVDKMPPGVFESITSLLDYNVLLSGSSSTKAIFLFLSNTAGVQISDRLASLIKDGMVRDETRLSDFEQILAKAAYNLEGGLKKASLIEAHAIDHYIPFLPLEKSHVEKCLVAEFRRYQKPFNQKAIDTILKDVIVYDRVHKLFSTSGCKTIEKKVAIYAMSDLY